MIDSGVGSGGGACGSVLGSPLLEGDGDGGGDALLVGGVGDGGGGVAGARGAISRATAGQVRLSSGADGGVAEDDGDFGLEKCGAEEVGEVAAGGDEAGLGGVPGDGTARV